LKIVLKKFIYIFLLSSISVFSQLTEKKQSYIVGEVIVSGNTTFSPQTIVTYSGLGKGDKVTLPGEKN
jgi:outer membrane protein insertion porin family